MAETEGAHANIVAEKIKHNGPRAERGDLGSIDCIAVRIRSRSRKWRGMTQIGKHSLVTPHLLGDTRPVVGTQYPLCQSVSQSVSLRHLRISSEGNFADTAKIEREDRDSRGRADLDSGGREREREGEGDSQAHRRL